MNQFMIPIFSGKNYDHWAFRMKTIFHSQELLEIVVNGFVEPLDESLLAANQKNELKENMKKDIKAFQIIQQGLDDTVLARINEATTAKRAWEILETTYQGISKVKLSKLL